MALPPLSPVRIIALALLPTLLPALLPALLLAAAPARAAEAWGGSVGASSRYVFRGLLQRGAAASAHLDLHTRFVDTAFAGVWLSGGPDPRGSYGRQELNVYAGFDWQPLERWSLSWRAVHYRYPDSRFGRGYDYDDFTATAAFDDRLSLSLSTSPNTTLFSVHGLVEQRRAHALEASLRQALWGPVSLLAAAGYYDTRAHFGVGYHAWHLGLAARWGSLELTLQRFGTDGTARRLFRQAAADGYWALGAAWSF